MDMARWSRSDLKRPGTALGVAMSFVFAVALATAAACNIHEMAHAVTGSVLGWEVERVNPLSAGRRQRRVCDRG